MGQSWYGDTAMRHTFFLAVFGATVASSAVVAIAACGSSSSSSPSAGDAGDDGEAPDTSAAAPPNLADNPSFEQSGVACAPPWEPVGQSAALTTATFGHEGQRSCQICNAGAERAEVGVVVRVPIDPAVDGKTPYALEAFFRDLDGGAEGGNAGRLTLLPEDGTGAPIEAGAGEVDVPIQAGTWRSFSTSATPTKAAKKIEARVGGVLAPNGCIAVDDVVLYRAQ